jgi:hypothetical protein
LGNAPGDTSTSTSTGNASIPSSENVFNLASISHPFHRHCAGDSPPLQAGTQEKHSLTVLRYAEGKLNVVLADHHGHGAALGFQQIQGGQQILPTFSRRDLWLTGVVAAVYLILIASICWPP